MSALLQNASLPLSFIAGPAILANACAILQNGVALRHSLAVAQWRELSAWRSTTDPRLPALYADPVQVLVIARRRLRLQLRQTEMLLVAACLFGLTSLIAVVGSSGALSGDGPVIAAFVVALLTTGGLGLALMVAVSACFVVESLCARRMIRLHAMLDAPLDGAAPLP
ncbi:hypothetical protein [Coralloluteibacterium stylophorae]|uniref:DUF2721 domain-containing protein n=1 Tax=Coralloluteibacterium stylophorae TaxID=1776034 RepID=A0A8J7VQT5_9GAMM|nr:hypothetical protein [Coralloluteibacterium stylophorae]MBS7458130.1 hypothetical protein [Coralloluteibacterium stylophorae]